MVKAGPGIADRMNKTIREEKAHSSRWEVGYQRSFQTTDPIIREVKQVSAIVKQAEGCRQQGTGYRKVAEEGQDQIHIAGLVIYSPLMASTNTSILPPLAIIGGNSERLMLPIVTPSQKTYSSRANSVPMIGDAANLLI